MQTQGSALIEMANKIKQQAIKEKYTQVSVYRYRVTEEDGKYKEGWEIAPVTLYYTVMTYDGNDIPKEKELYSREVYDKRLVAKDRLDNLITLAQLQNHCVEEYLDGKTPIDILAQTKSWFEDQTASNAYRYQSKYSGSSPMRIEVGGKVKVDFKRVDEWADNQIERMEKKKAYAAAHPIEDTQDQLIEAQGKDKNGAVISDSRQVSK